MSLHVNSLFKNNSGYRVGIQLLIKCNKSNYSKASAKTNRDKGSLLISCKESKYNFYTGMTHDKFDEKMLASKGWTHYKARGDYFIIHPQLEEAYEETKPFSELGIHPAIVKVLADQGIHHATRFQNQAMSVVFSDKHTLLAAETGCGKTISYLIPIIQKLSGQKQKGLNMPKALILIPTRELAQQIGRVASTLCEPFELKVKVLVGGGTKKIMINPEFSDVDIVVATPGVIGKLSTVGIYRLGSVQHTVLDEADSLTDDSFEQRMSSLLNRVPQSQLILVSATIPKTLPNYLKPIEPIVEQVISPKIHKPLLNITQKFMRLTRTTRPAELLSIAKNSKQQMMVFTNQNKTCFWLSNFLRENGLKCANVNGDQTHDVRIEQWNDFVRGNVDILAATDIASRGLNTTQINHVVNFDFPVYMADYLHRIGRTGRFGSPELCKVTNFVCGVHEIKLVQQIEVC